MKRSLFLLLCAVVLSLALPSKTTAQQRYEFQDSLGTYRVEFVPHDNQKGKMRFYKKRTDYTGQHEFRLGLAYNAYTPNGYMHNDVMWTYSPLEHPNNTILGNTRWFTLNGDYGYWVRRWLYVGGVASWTGGFKRISSAIDHSRVDCYNYHTICIMPIVRFAWVNRGCVQLYSGVGVAPSVAIYEHDLHSTPLVNWGWGYDVTFFGISVGRNFFGYLDIGAGTRGVISAGIGYRFKSNSKK